MIGLYKLDLYALRKKYFRLKGNIFSIIWLCCIFFGFTEWMYWLINALLLLWIAFPQIDLTRHEEIYHLDKRVMTYPVNAGSMVTSRVLASLTLSSVFIIAFGFLNVYGVLVKHFSAGLFLNTYILMTFLGILVMTIGIGLGFGGYKSAQVMAVILSVGAVFLPFTFSIPFGTADKKAVSFIITRYVGDHFSLLICAFLILEILLYFTAITLLKRRMKHPKVS